MYRWDEDRAMFEFVCEVDVLPKHKRGEVEICPCGNREGDRLFSFESEDDAKKTADNKKKSLEKVVNTDLNITKSDVYNTNKEFALRSVGKEEITLMSVCKIDLACQCVCVCVFVCQVRVCVCIVGKEELALISVSKIHL